MPVTAQFQFADDYASLTKMANKVKFIGFDKKVNNPEMEKLLGNIQRYYKLNEQQAMEYFEMMDDTQRDRFYNMYEEGLQ